MKKMNKMICLLMCIASLLFPSQPVSALAESPLETKPSIADEKIYCDATIDQKFADNAVLVVLDKNVGAINKVHDKSFFSAVNVQNLVDLTAIPSYDVTKTSHDIASKIDEDNFRQIIKLELPKKSKENVLKVIKQLEKIDGVIYAGPDYITSPNATSASDTSFSDQWALEKIQITEAWDITTGSVNVRVGVIDDGIASHPDLNANVINGWDSYNDNTTTSDTEGEHGTHVAGIIGAVGYNNEGISGVAWNISLVPLQVTYDGVHAFISDEIEAISYATSNNIPIINFSRGSRENSFAFKQAIVNYPGLFVCAAGNHIGDIDENPYYPSSFNCANIISVANSNSSDEIYSTSNFGKTIVHLAAPGTAILSTVPDGVYETKTGTSMAAPHVAGVAALIYSIRPDLTATEVKSLILNNVDKVDALSDKCITGGRLNAYKAVRAATEPQTFTGDVNGDGKSDMILSRNVNGKRALTVYLGKNGGYFETPITTISSRNFVYTHPAYVGDFNGDGLTDLVIHWRSNSRRQLLVYISKGDGYFYEGANLSSTRFHDQLQMPCYFFVADVNGDNKDDFIVHYRNTSGKRCALVYKGTASSPYLIDATTDALISINTYYPNDPVYVGDFNGDGCSDMLVQWVDYGSRQLLVYKGNSDGTFSPGENLSSDYPHAPETYPGEYFVTDVNGDGKDDFVLHYKDSNNRRSALVYYGTSEMPYLNDAIDALISTNSYVESDPVFVGDINGDGRSDMIVQWSLNGYYQFLIYTANANGSYNAAVRLSTSIAYDLNTYAGTYRVADVNGDGCDDFIIKYKNGNSNAFLTLRGTSSGSFMPTIRTIPTTSIPYYNAT